MSEQERRQVKGWVPDTNQRTQKEIDDLDYILRNTGYMPVPELPPTIELNQFPIVKKPEDLPEVGKNRKTPLFRMVKPEDLE